MTGFRLTDAEYDISIPYGAIKRYGEWTINGKTLISIPYGAIKRPPPPKAENTFFSISIPYGAIKRSKQSAQKASRTRFQFLMVRLKAFKHICNMVFVV